MSEVLEAFRQDADKCAYQLPRSSSREEALEIAIRASESSVQALKLTQDPREKAELSTRVKRLLEVAERIKFRTDWRQEVLSSTSTVPYATADSDNVGTVRGKQTKKLKEPQSSRTLSKSEQILILKAGYLNCCKFPPWTSQPAPSDFELRDGEDPFIDTPELRLSELQDNVLEDWMRPADALPPPSFFPSDCANPGPSMRFSRKIDLVQDASTDCSVVASLCAIVSRAERGHAKILENVIFPYDAKNDRPLISENGKYIARLHFNGSYRRVVIDDRLPVSSTSRVIHVIDRNNPDLLWPALIEKAYLKVRGGYDFPGSNSATDLWILTGWIPEQVFLQSEDLEPSRLWGRMSNALNNGDVLITMGTGKMTAKTERELGLAGEHDYAILDLRVVKDQRLMLVKNPWCQGMSWRGRFQDDPCSNTEKGQETVRQAPIKSDDDAGHVETSRDLMNADEKLSPGTFWMDLDNVIQNFESIYLNWNPGLFTQRQDKHFIWDLTQRNGHGNPRSRFASLSNHPQFAVKAQNGGTVWILLCRHLKNAIPAAATEEEIEAGRHAIDLNGHITLAAFTARGHRVLLAEKYIARGVFIDSPQILLKLDDCILGISYTIVPLEQDLIAIEQTFTLSVFSHSPITIVEATTSYPHSNTLTAEWTKDTAGGNANNPTYSANPQFSVVVPRKTAISLLLEATSDELNVHVKLVHSRGHRVHSIRARDIVFDSKDYRRGCCVAESTEVEPGQYTIICSTFEPQQLGEFKLLVESSEPTQTVLLPREGAGRLRTEVSHVTFKRGQSAVAAPLAPSRLVKFYALARPLIDQNSGSSASNRSMLRLSIEFGGGDERRVISASGSGDYADSTAGVRTDDVDLNPDIKRYGEVWLVLSRVHASSEVQEERFTVELFVDSPESVVCGVWREWDDML